MKRVILETGTHFFYENFNSELDNNHAILLVHGACQTSFCFRDMISKEFPMDTQYVSINLTGFGKSYNPSVTIDPLELIIQDLYSFLTWYSIEHGIKTWDIIAYSYGTYVTLNFLMKYEPDFINKIILTAPYGIFSHTSSYGFYWAFLIKHKLYQKCISLINTFVKFHNYVLECHNFSHDLIADGIHLDPSGAFINAPLINNFYKLKHKVHLIYGGEDTICPYDQGNILQIMYPDIVSRVYVLKNQDHYVLYSTEFKLLVRKILFQTPLQTNLVPSILSTFNIWKTKIDIQYLYRKIIH